MIFAERTAAHQRCVPQSAAALNSLSRYSGGGLARGFWIDREGTEDPHPNPPPEYREREILSRSRLCHAPAQQSLHYAISLLSLLLILVSSVALSGCNRSTKSATTGKATFTVFAAASLTQPFTQIAHEFENQHPGTDVVLNFAGSQQLIEQLIQGAPADVFASADHRQMDRAVSASLVDSPTLTDFANNRLVVIVSKKNPNPPQALGDLTRKGLRVDVADPVVPVGQYTLVMLDRLAADPQYGPSFKSGFLNNVVSREENVKAVLTKVRLGEADAGVVYTSDTVGVPSQEIGTIEVPDAFNPMASYPIAVVNKSNRKDLAKAFEALVLSADGQSILQKDGLTSIHHPTTHP